MMHKFILSMLDTNLFRNACCQTEYVRVKISTTLHIYVPVPLVNNIPCISQIQSMTLACFAYAFGVVQEYTSLVCGMRWKLSLFGDERYTK